MFYLKWGPGWGFADFRGRVYSANRTAPPGEYAPEPLMSFEDWEAIISFYEDEAPLVLEVPTPEDVAFLDFFEVEMPEKSGIAIPTTTAVFIDDQSNRILIGDGGDATLTIYSSDLEAIGDVYAEGPISRISRLPDGSYLATSMGAIGREMEPIGALSIVEPVPDTPTAFGLSPLVGGLLRPVDMAMADVNEDGMRDYVVADFGRYDGALSLYVGEADGQFREIVLLVEDGPISVEMDGDDRIALIAQEDERIVRFRNLDDGLSPTEEVLLRFPPSQGSSSLTVLDFNKDGVSDLLYMAGDNADISPIFKPSHGIYLYLDDGDGGFRLELFRHLDGAYDVVVRNFDNDGVLDIAAIAYFENFLDAPETAGFAYLENTIEGFKGYNISGLGHLGRWVAIHAGDVDADGDQDIVLGNLAYGAVGPAQVTNKLRDNWMSGPNFVLLRNQTQ